MTDRSEVIRVQNDVLLNEYHQLIGAQIRRIDTALAVLDNERRNLMGEREHLLKHLPPPVENRIDDRIQEQAAQPPKFIQQRKDQVNG
jgi:hypothetical protein